MKKKFYPSLFFSIIISSALLMGGGCSSKKVVTSPTGSEQEEYNIPAIPPAQDANEGYGEEDLPPMEGSLDDTDSTAAQELAIKQSAAYLKQHGRSSIEFQPVYFKFDQTMINPEMQEVIFNNAQVLKKNPAIHISIEGNTDDRGTNEYNMALGEKRAINVEKYLISLGISEKRMRTVSLGEERPLFPAQTESAYLYNRRADFIIE